MKKKTLKIATSLVVILMIFNVTISSAAAIRQKDRMNNIKPRNKVEEFLDKHYPDEYLDKIFSNKINKNWKL